MARLLFTKGGSTQNSVVSVIAMFQQIRLDAGWAGQLENLDKSQVSASAMMPTARNVISFTVSRFGSSGSID